MRDQSPAWVDANVERLVGDRRSVGSAFWRGSALALLVALTLATGCGGPNGRRPGPLRVVAATSIPGELARRVAGSDAEVEVLAGANSDPHGFSPTQADTKHLYDADVLLSVGLRFAPWLPKLIEASGTRAKHVELSTGIAKLIPIGGGDDDEDDADDHGHDHGHEHEHGETDPHIWHDVTNAMQMVAAIRDALVAADADHAEGYKERAARLIGELEELDSWVQLEVKKIPESQRMLITAHDNLRYFARRYGFRVLGDLLDSASTQGHDPSMGKARRVLELITEHKVRAVFTENTTQASYLEGIARDADVPAHRLFTDSLGDESLGEPATYVDLVRHNVKTLVTALAD